MIATQLDEWTAPVAATGRSGLPSGRRPVDWRRVWRPATVVCFAGSLIAAVAASLGSVVAGQLADDAAARLVWVLAALLIGGAVIDTIAKTAWSVIVDRAEGALRADLLDAAMAQPLPELSEQAVGEILDRIGRGIDLVAGLRALPGLRRRRAVGGAPHPARDITAQGA